MRHKILNLALVAMLVATLILSSLLTVAAAPAQQEGPAAQPAGVFRGVSTAVKFDVSPPLRDMAPLAPQESKPFEIRELSTGLEGALGPQDADGALQTSYGPSLIPAPIISFNGPPNISSVSPPDPVGDVGPNHYVAMSNLSFQIFDKAGNSLFGPALNNTLWAGFGGPCQTENSGDPIVLYDQLSDRWMLSQFTSSGPTYYNCVAVSQTPDPTGAYYRWAFSNGNNFPDYPKYGFWSDALYISTRDFLNGSSFSGVGAIAINRAQLIAGNPTPTVISFQVPPGTTPYNIGDGLLPADLDGSTLPPAGTPNFFMGSMDNGGPYGAPQDALTLWKFTADFTTPANSSFVLANTIPIASYDTIPAFCSGRSCVPQPGTSNRIDHLGYRQRPMHRLAYRNFGSHESLVTNQSVEASASMSGIRWWEIRSPNSSPVLYQDNTYAPGVTDGIHRWMGSIAMDGAGNMALGYSASNGTTTFPSSWYTGRLASDPLNTMLQGEGIIVNGTGSQTGSQRWGDYTSMNIDPVDDCTFWYVNQWVPTTSSVGWQLRIGAFRFAQCGTADFTLGATPQSVDVCAPANATYTVNVGQVSGFTNPVTLGTTGTPAGATTNFSVNPVTPPGSSALTVGTAAVAAGNYSFDITGSSTTGVKNVTVGLNVATAAPGAPALLTPANGALNVPAAPTFTWNAVAGASAYSIQVATDAGFSTVVASASGLVAPTWTSNVTLNTSTLYYWRVQANNACGVGVYSATWNFTTVAAPGDCTTGTTPNILYTDGFEAGIGGWTTPAGVGTNTWAIATANPHSGVNHMRGLDPSSATDQRLVSPAIALPTGENPVVLKFWHVPNMENSGTTACFDGGILEVSSDGGTTWTQVPNANLLVGPYTGAISSSFGNPLAGLQAWCNGSAYSNVIADVSSYAGQTVQFRFRLGSDSSVSDVGWDVDDVMVQSCQTSVVDPNIDVSPLSLSATQATNTTTQQTLTVANTGGGTLNWQITEDTLLATPIGSAPQMAAPSAGTTGSRSAPGGGAAPIVYSSPADFSEDFADITNLPGWFFQNNSSPLGLTNWFQGNDTVFPAHAGASTAYIGANFNNTSGAGDISNWMLTPQLNLANGDTISFWTRTATGSSWPDRVELRLSTAGASTNVGTLATDVGDFTTLLLSVNPTLVAGGYPEVWTQYTATLSGISGGASGRIAFRYFVTNGGPSGANSNYIGIDTVEYTAAQTVVCDAPSAIPWLSESPSSGSNAGSTNTPVQVTFDSTGLAVGIYTANLCVTSNDPNTGPGNGTNLVIVPVTLTVQPPTAVTLSSVTAASSQSPAPLAGLPLAALPLAAAAAMAGALAFLRRKQ